MPWQELFAKTRFASHVLQPACCAKKNPGVLGKRRAAEFPLREGLRRAWVVSEVCRACGMARFQQRNPCAPAAPCPSSTPAPWMPSSKLTSVDAVDVQRENIATTPGPSREATTEQDRRERQKRPKGAFSPRNSGLLRGTFGSRRDSTRKS
jgi:hypothetical protein